MERGTEQMIERVRRFRMEDLEAMIPFIEACKVEDPTTTTPTVENLRHQISMPGVDVEKHLYVVPEANGDLIAFGGGIPVRQAEADTFYTNIAIHPDCSPAFMDEFLQFIEARSIESQLEAYSESPTESPQEAHTPALFHASAPAHPPRYGAMYERNGFQAVRYFLQLERDLQHPIEPAPLPDHLTIRPMNLDTDLEAYHFTWVDAFRDHWNTPEFSLEQTRHMLESPDTRPDLILLAFGPNDEPAGVCANSVRTEYNAQHGTREGMIEMLGVRRPFRRNGLARALLTRSLQLLKAENLTTAVLVVDADSPTGATRLYGAVGFKERKRSTVYQKPLP